MDPLVALEIVVAVEGLWALVALEGAVVLLLLLPRVMSVHWPAHLVLWILHVHAAYQRHLVSWVVHVGHNRTIHRWKIVAPVRWSRPIALRSLHLRMALRRNRGNAARLCLRGAWRLLSWRLLRICRKRRSAVASRMVYSKSGSGEVSHHNREHEEALGVALASCSFAAVAAAVVAEAQEWVDFAVGRQTSLTLTWRSEMEGDLGHTAAEEVPRQLLENWCFDFESSSKATFPCSFARTVAGAAVVAGAQMGLALAVLN